MDRTIHVKICVLVFKDSLTFEQTLGPPSLCALHSQLCNPVVDLFNLLVYCVVSSEDVAQTLELSVTVSSSTPQKGMCKLLACTSASLPTTRILVFCVLTAKPYVRNTGIHGQYCLPEKVSVISYETDVIHIHQNIDTCCQEALRHIEHNQASTVTPQGIQQVAQTCSILPAEPVRQQHVHWRRSQRTAGPLTCKPPTQQELLHNAALRLCGEHDSMSTQQRRRYARLHWSKQQQRNPYGTGSLAVSASPQR